MMIVAAALPGADWCVTPPVEVSRSAGANGQENLMT
jgi:hypothetical protein